MIGLERALWLPRVERDGNSPGNRHFNNQSTISSSETPSGYFRRTAWSARLVEIGAPATVRPLKCCSTAARAASRISSVLLDNIGLHPPARHLGGRGRGLSINFDSMFFTKSPARGTLGSNPSFWSRERHPHPPSRSANSRPAFVVGLFFSQGSEWRYYFDLYDNGVAYPDGQGTECKVSPRRSARLWRP